MQWTQEDRAFHEAVIHKVYEGIRHENADLVADALLDLEIWAAKRTFWRGFFWGCLLGTPIATILLSSC